MSIEKLEFLVAALVFVAGKEAYYDTLCWGGYEDSHLAYNLHLLEEELTFYDKVIPQDWTQGRYDFFPDRSEATGSGNT